MYILNADVIEPGDIILTAQDAKISKGIRRLTQSTFSHAILYVAHSSYIHSDADGVHANNTQRLLFSAESDALALRLVRAKDRQKVSAICAYARSQVGMQYSIPEAIASRKNRSAKVVGLRSNRQFCSRLVAQAYAYAGVPLVPNPNFCYPTDLHNVDIVAHVSNCLRVAAPQEIKFAKSPNPLDIQKKSTNLLLEGIRNASGEDIQSEEQVIELLLRRPEIDDAASGCLIESGYLSLWEIEVSNNPWRYEKTFFENENIPEDFLIREIESAQSLIDRFRFMHHQFTALISTRPLKYFFLQQMLYAKLLELNMTRLSLLENVTG